MIKTSIAKIPYSGPKSFREIKKAIKAEQDRKRYSIRKNYSDYVLSFYFCGNAFNSLIGRNRIYFRKIGYIKFDISVSENHIKRIQRKIAIKYIKSKYDSVIRYERNKDIRAYVLWNEERMSRGYPFTSYKKYKKLKNDTIIVPDKIKEYQHTEALIQAIMGKIDPKTLKLNLCGRFNRSYFVTILKYNIENIDVERLFCE